LDQEELLRLLQKFLNFLGKGIIIPATALYVLAKEMLHKKTLKRP